MSSGMQQLTNGLRITVKDRSIKRRCRVFPNLVYIHAMFYQYSHDRAFIWIVSGELYG